MTHSRNRSIPGPAVRRLTRYLEAVREYSESGSEWISSREIADSLGLTSSTVRQDLSYLDFSGISKRGYQVGPLREVIEYSLGADSDRNVIIVGAGNLGKALALHGGFAGRKVNIRALFDKDSGKVGKKVGKLTVMDMRRLNSVVKNNNIDIGIIAVPGAAAQSVADALVSSGVKGLLNLASAHLTAPAGVAVEDVRIVACLQALSYAVKERAARK
ncbi:MAG: redox-sensing transcriptional repressor Rex [Kiritimatiellia bacterium]